MYYILENSALWGDTVRHNRFHSVIAEIGVKERKREVFLVQCHWLRTQKLIMWTSLYDHFSLEPVRVNLKVLIPTMGNV